MFKVQSSKVRRFEGSKVAEWFGAKGGAMDGGEPVTESRSVALVTAAWPTAL